MPKKVFGNTQFWILLWTQFRNYLLTQPSIMAGQKYTGRMKHLAIETLNLRRVELRKG